MKMSLMGKMYPAVIRKYLKQELCKKFSNQENSQVLKHADREYKEVVGRAPDLGGKENIFLGSFYLGAYVIAVYKTVKDRITIAELDKMIDSAMNNMEFIKKKAGKNDLTSKSYKDKLARASSWLEKNKNRYPTNWQLTVPAEQKENETVFTFTRCGLCALCISEGVPEINPSLCRTDYTMMSFCGCKLNRTQTLGSGGTCCDFHIIRNEKL